MQVIRILIINLFSLTTIGASGQNQVDTTQVLELRQKINFTESNKFWVDSNIVVMQEVSFNDPHVIDEGCIQLLRIKFLDKSALNEKVIFDTVKDSLIIKCSYDRLSVWNWSKRQTEIAGQVQLISKNKRRIVLEFNLIITEPGKRVYVYAGRRKFHKTKPLEKYTIE